MHTYIANRALTWAGSQHFSKVLWTHNNISLIKWHLCFWQVGLDTKVSKVRTSKKKKYLLQPNQLFSVRTFGCPVPTHGRGLNSWGQVLWAHNTFDVNRFFPGIREAPDLGCKPCILGCVPLDLPCLYGVAHHLMYHLIYNIYMKLLTIRRTTWFTISARSCSQFDVPLDLPYLYELSHHLTYHLIYPCMRSCSPFYVPLDLPYLYGVANRLTYHLSCHTMSVRNCSPFDVPLNLPYLYGVAHHLTYHLMNHFYTKLLAIRRTTWFTLTIRSCSPFNVPPDLPLFKSVVNSQHFWKQRCQHCCELAILLKSCGLILFC